MEIKNLFQISFYNKERSDPLSVKNKNTESSIENEDLYNLDIELELMPKEIESKVDTATQIRMQYASGTPCDISFNSRCCTNLYCQTRPDINYGTMCSKC